MAIYKVEVVSTFEVEAEDEFTAIKKAIEIINKEGMDIRQVNVERKG